MARLETQINQIYLTQTEDKKNSLILYEEQLTNSLQLFIVAELWNMEKKSESSDLKKISEIILRSFRGNKKLPAETLFETSLSQINQNLADIAHEGRKSWVGKFSCLICIKGLDNNIYVANNGQTQALLKRKSDIIEVLPAEKRGNHPLKTFVNFTQGKLTNNDSLILTTSNIFNYISFELFSKLLDQLPLDQASEEVSKILRESKTDAAFCSFLLHFSKNPIEETIPTPQQEIYAPLPEEGLIEKSAAQFKFKIPKIPRPSFRLPSLPSLPQLEFNKFQLPSVNLEWIKKIHLPYFQNLSRAGKFFFLSFTLFLILFLINLGFYAFKLQGKKSQNRITQLVDQINNNIAQTQSALIYKNETEAIKQLNNTLTDLEELSGLDPAKALELQAKVEQVKTVVNKINVVSDPKTYVELQHHPLYLSFTSIGFLFGNIDSNSLSLFANNKVTDYFLLNSLKQPITGINHFAPAGVVVASGNQVFRIDQTLKQFEPIVTVTGNIKQLKFSSNALYLLTDKQIIKITVKNSTKGGSTSGGNYQTQVSISGDFSQARDFGIDKDIYVLFADKIIKYVGGKPQAFPLPTMTEPLSNSNKIFVAANLYILENNKKRIIVLNKNGALMNQIYFPTTTELTDLHVDEPTRSIFLLDDNKLYKITF